MFRRPLVAVASTATALLIALAGVSSASAAGNSPSGSPGSTPPATVPGPQPGTPAAEDRAQPDDALFRVGTAVVDISPDKPMDVGGYGSGYSVTGGVHDPLQVRAFFVGHGKQAVTFVSVDAQGWFAAYQAPNAGDGADDARREAAAGLADRGYDVSAANVVVSATHDHAAPTIQGIWGHTDPAYLHRVRQAAVQAVLEAESNARDAELWTATGSIRGLLSQVQGTDQMAGFSVDTHMPILWARKPGTGATVAVYADVPVHADQYNSTAAGNNQFTADYPGYVRDRLSETLGGTAVIAMGTLGRQEGIGADPSYDEVAEQGRFITNSLTRALTHARRMTDTTLTAATSSFSTAAENTGLLAAMSCNHPGGPIGCPGPLTEPASNGLAGTWDWRPVGKIFTINRSLATPYFAAGPRIGTSSTVARVGDQLYATAPGEAFPEVTEAIQRSYASSAGHPRRAHHRSRRRPARLLLGRARWCLPTRPARPERLRQVQRRLAPGPGQRRRGPRRRRGARPAPTAEPAYAQKDDPNAFSKPTIQFYPNRLESDEPAVSFYATAKKAQAAGSASTSIGSTAGTQGDNAVSWDFGDGAVETRPNETRFTHAFPGPGTYPVQASVTDNLGNTYRWTETVVIDPPLKAAVDQEIRFGKVSLSARAVGGQGSDTVAAHWTFSDGTTADGPTVTRKPGRPVQADVMITDGAGNTALTSVGIK